MKPSAFGVLGVRLCSDDAIGSSVNVMFLNDAATSRRRAPCRSPARCPVDTSLLGLRGFVLIRSIGVDEALDELRDDVGVGVEELGAARSGCVVTNLPFGHRSPRRRGSCRRRRSSLVAYGSGTHAPSMSPGWNAVRVVRVVLRDDRDVTAAVRCRSCRPFASARCAARRPGCCRADGVATFLPLRSAALLMSRLHDEERAARRGAGDDADRRALRLLVGVDRGVRADERRVDARREQRGRRRRCRR